MDKEQYGKAKACLIACMQEGHSWRKAKAIAGLQISQSNAYQLWRAFREYGEVALADGRHGHPSKLCGAARAFLEEQCRQAPQTPSSAIQMALREYFDLHVSISQINRVRAALGVSNHRTSRQQGKKRQGREVLSLSQSGRTVLAVFCYLLLLIKRACSKSFKQPSNSVTSPLIHRCVSPTINQQHYAVSC
jgi:transposase